MPQASIHSVTPTQIAIVRYGRFRMVARSAYNIRDVTLLHRHCNSGCILLFCIESNEFARCEEIVDSQGGSDVAFKR